MSQANLAQAETFSLAVLNLHGSDQYQSFESGAGIPDDGTHPPINYHGFAACAQGVFCQKIEQIPSHCRNVIVLLRGDMRYTIEAIRALKKSGKRIAISIQETGTNQVAEMFGRIGVIQHFREACQSADAAIATTHETLPLYEASGCSMCEFIPTPYPLETDAWNFSQPFEARNGILIGTRQPRHLFRNHQLALELIKPLAACLGQTVTVINERTGDSIRPNYFGVQWRHCELRWHQAQNWPAGLQIVPRRMAYPQYLKLMAQHRIVFQLDSGAVPGQVAGDALLCRVPCVGGNGTTERLAFPALCGFGRDPGELVHIARQLLEDNALAQSTMSEALTLAEERLAFVTINGQLRRFFDRLN